MKWNGWIKSKNENDGEAKNKKRSDDPLKSNMKWSHIVNECIDGNDNDPESLREGHSSHSQRNMTKWIKRNKDPRKLTYELSITTYLIKWPSNINIYTQWWRILRTYTHVLIFLFFSLFSSFFLVFFFYIYTNAHTLNMKKKKPKRWYQ